MAVNNQYDNIDPISLNVEGVADLVQSKTNRVSREAGSRNEGPTGAQQDDLALDMDNAELLLLATQWASSYAGYEGRLRPKQEKNKQYYLGSQQAGYQPFSYDDVPIAGNLIFEAEETFLAAALSKDPDPVVWSDNTPEGQKLADDTSSMLTYHASTLKLRKKLLKMVRQWSINYLGVLKYGWDEDLNDIKVETRPIQNFVFDTHGFVDAYGHFNGYLGERIKLSARELIEKFPAHKAYIALQVDGKLGTECTYTEWWTDEFTFSTFEDLVLEKMKNPFYKHGKKSRNHFGKPMKPFTFLSIFSFGEQPHDVTNLIEQNIPNQNLIAREIHQLDYNISRNNNSTAFSENNFNQQTAKQATQAWVKGHNILVPPGVPIGEAIVNFPVTPIPDSFFKNLEINMQNLRSIFGTQGLTAQQPNEETTARGMILNQQRDNSRIGGAISEAVEGVADSAFNWFVQLYHVFYDTKHVAMVIGTLKAVEYVTLSSSMFDRSIVISVQPDSMKPRDEITAANQAESLWQGQALGLKTFLTLQKIGDPQDAMEDALLWKAGLMPYIAINSPELYQKLLAFQQAGQPSPQPQAGEAASPTNIVPEQAPASGGEPPNASLAQVPLPA